MGKLITITGLEGAGKSTLAANLSYMLAEKEQVVVLIASNLNYGGLQLFTGDEITPDKGIFACLSDKSGQPEKYLTQSKANPNIFLLGVPNDTNEPYTFEIERPLLEGIFNKLSPNFDFIIVDGTSGLYNPISILSLLLSQYVFEVLQINVKSSLRNKAINSTLSQLCQNTSSGDITYIISEHNVGCHLKLFLDSNNITPAFFIPYVPHAHNYESASKLICSDKRGKSMKYKKAVGKIASNLISGSRGGD